MLMGAPGEDVLVHEVDHSRNPQDQAKEAALKVSQSQKQLANAPKAVEVRRKKPQAHHMKNSASQLVMVKVPNPLSSSIKTQNFVDGFAISFNERSKTRALQTIDGPKTSRPYNGDRIGEQMIAPLSPKHDGGSKTKKGKRKKLNSNYVDMNKKIQKYKPSQNTHLFTSINYLHNMKEVMDKK